MTEHVQLTFKDHARKRALYAGSAVATAHESWILEGGIFKKKILQYGDAMLNCIDEILVNAIDHYVRSVKNLLSTGGPVTYIKISFDKATGRICVSNDGKGIPVVQKWTGQTEPGWMPEAIISKERMGSNFDDEANSDRLTGGLNGLGLKVANVASREFTLETVCCEERKYYKQTCRDRMEYIDPPVVIDLPRNASELKSSGLTDAQIRSHTTFWILPCYDMLNKKTKEESDPDWYRTNADVVEHVLRLRAYQTAAFIGALDYKTEKGVRTVYKKASVYFNDMKIPVVGMTGFMKMFVKGPACTVLSGPEIEYPWIVGIGLLGQLDRTDVKTKDVEHMSIVNGIHVSQGGSHVNLMIKKICEGLSGLCGKEVGEGIFKKVFMYFDCKQFPFKQLDFKSQTKEKITIGTGDQAALRGLYKLPDTFVKAVWELGKAEITFILEKKEYAEQVSSARSKGTGTIRKYDPPEVRGVLSGLFCAEGDSALQTVRDMIKMEGTPLDKRLYGTYSLNGVPPNALKMIKVMTLGGETIVQANHQLRENITFKGFVRAIGLDYGYKYELDAGGDKEYSKLHAGFIVLATDQDVDGIGQICTMVMVFIMCFWPNLIKRGFIKRLATPLIRIYCEGGTGDDRGRVFEFYSEGEYDVYVAGRWGGSELPRGYRAEYYKGLGGHTRDEVLNMGKTILKNIFTITWDAACEALMNVMYGEDTTERKKMLTTPVTDAYESDVWTTRNIPLSTHLRVEGKEFKLTGMRRKLRSCIDGLIVTQRKLLAGGRQMFGGSLRKSKVFQVGGYISKELHYGQGDASINETLKKMAQTFEGACNLPVFIPISIGFGNNVDGRGTTGGSRYLDTRYNDQVMDLMFPRVDDWLLEYVYEDGVRCEPKYYVSIMPMAILESENTTGHGWKIDVVGRNYEWVDAQVRKRIRGDLVDNLFGHPWFKSPGLSMRLENDREVSYGDYEYNATTNTIHITQLPYRVWSYPYECWLKGIDPSTGKTERMDKKTGEMIQLKKKPYITKVKDDTANGKNNIMVWLEDGAYEKIVEEYGTPLTDPIEHFLGLRSVMMMNLNMITDTGYVREFATYNEVFDYWYPKRRDLYIARIERMLLLNQYRIAYWKEVLRFILMDGSDSKEINIDKDKTEEERDKILSGAGFTRYNKSTLFNPGYLRAEQLHAAIFESGGASYGYISDITIGDKSQKSVDALRAKIEALEAELVELRKQTWQSIWLAELDKLLEKVRFGLRTNWKYSDKSFTFLSGSDADTTTKPKRKKAAKE